MELMTLLKYILIKVLIVYLGNNRIIRRKMVYRFNWAIKWMVASVLVAYVGMMLQFRTAMAATKYGLSVAPMEQDIILNLNESRDASFTIANPSSATEDMYYKISVEPFYVDESGNTIFEAEGDSGEIVNWITFNMPTEGKISPNEVKEVAFTIDVPDKAPAGGQYAAIFVTTTNNTGGEQNDGPSDENESTRMGINEIRRIGHLIYAEVAGTTVRKGEISDAVVPSFLLSGNIRGTSLVRNIGNVHGDAKYTLRVFPLFSDEEIYSNVEEPEKRTVLPERALYSETVWDHTPGIGIFNVVYTVEFEGSTAEVSKMVIVCPVWLLFLIVFAIVALVMWIVIRAKMRGRARGELNG